MVENLSAAVRRTLSANWIPVRSCRRSRAGDGRQGWMNLVSATRRVRKCCNNMGCRTR
jgi:hypothetical protein